MASRAMSNNQRVKLDQTIFLVGGLKYVCSKLARWCQMTSMLIMDRSATIRARVSYDFYVKSSSRYSLVHLSSSKSAARPTILYDFYVRSSSGYSLVHLSIFQKCCEPDSFLRFLCELELWLRSLVHLLPTSSSKSAPSPIAFYGFYVRSSCGYTV